ncbi:CLUMA_CG002450, isoform A [Clunio marinus]|uniref:CLUMA_CG002450, isoform A n=1 Tax=Clunio marinus TaxID=568069 RepID=A0A1J1HMM6_9DIPT|nr:CLUMA_CG002450, isoform A [Clunio marinus]
MLWLAVRCEKIGYQGRKCKTNEFNAKSTTVERYLVIILHSHETDFTGHPLSVSVMNFVNIFCNLILPSGCSVKPALEY